MRAGITIDLKPPAPGAHLRKVVRQRQERIHAHGVHPAQRIVVMCGAQRLLQNQQHIALLPAWEFHCGSQTLHFQTESGPEVPPRAAGLACSTSRRSEVPLRMAIIGLIKPISSGVARIYEPRLRVRRHCCASVGGGMVEPPGDAGCAGAGGDRAARINAIPAPPFTPIFSSATGRVPL